MRSTIARLRDTVPDNTPLVVLVVMVMEPLDAYAIALTSLESIRVLCAVGCSGRVRWRLTTSFRLVMEGLTSTGMCRLFVRGDAMPPRQSQKTDDPTERLLWLNVVVADTHTHTLTDKTLILHRYAGGAGGGRHKANKGALHPAAKFPFMSRTWTQ